MMMGQDYDQLAMRYPLSASPPAGCAEAYAAVIATQKRLFGWARMAAICYRQDGAVDRFAEDMTDRTNAELCAAMADYYKQVRAAVGPQERRGRFGGRS